jgi:putative ABC transport system permease protein
MATWLKSLFRRHAADQDLDDEIAVHLELMTDENIAKGMTPEQARRAARLELGGVEQVKEAVRTARTGAWLETLFQDARFGLRVLGKSPLFAAVGVLTLALGIGVNSAFFSVVDAVLIRSLPFRNPGRLVAISETHPSIPSMGASVADFADWKVEAHSFDGLAAYDPTTLAHSAIMLHGESDEIRAANVSHGLFPLLGISPAMGRNFLAQEDILGNGPVVILSNRLWKTQFDARTNIMGSSITMNGKSYTVVGILPAGIRFPENVDAWLPLGNLDKADRANRFYHPLFVIGRLRPGVTVSEARTELAGIAERLARAYPQTNHDFGVNLQPLLETYVGGLRRYLLILWIAVVLVLLIACANVASLLLVRATTRQREMALRSALGASRERLFRQGLTESIVLGSIGGLFAVLFACATVPVLANWLPQILDAPILHVHEIHVSPDVVALTFAISLVSAVIFGLLPALSASRRDAGSVLQAHQRSSDSGGRLAHRMIVGGEVALAVMVLISAGLLVRSLQQLIATSPGFVVDHLLTMRISLSGERYRSDQARIGFYQSLFPRLRAMPGVEGVGTIDQTPLVSSFASSLASTRFLVAGAPPLRPGDYPVASFRQVSPTYFHTMGIPLLKGRTFRADDLTRDEESGMVINGTLEQRFFRGENPIGRKILLGVATGHLTKIPIVGVVGDTRDLSVDSPPVAEMYFVGFGQVSTLVVRSVANPSTTARAIRSAVLATDPSVPIFSAQTGSQLVDRSIARQRFSAMLLALFAAFALLLSAGGIYGVTSYAVARRTKEIGTRMALGAQPGHILRLVLRQEMIAPTVGLVIGIAGAFGATRLFSHLLYGVGAIDPLTYCGVCVIIAGATLFACYLPAKRATRVDPMVSLRYE